MNPSTSRTPSSRAWNDHAPSQARRHRSGRTVAPSVRRARGRRRRRRQAGGRRRGRRAGRRRRRTGCPGCGPSAGARAAGRPRTGRRRAARRPGAARCRRRAAAAGRHAPSWATATHDVCPPTRVNAGPGAGVEPRTPHRCRRIGAFLADRRARRPLLAAVSGRRASTSWSRSTASNGTAATRQAVRARSVDVRVPPSSSARSPRPAPGRPRPPRRRRLRRPARRRGGGTGRRRAAPCSVSVVPALSVRISGLAAPCIIDRRELTLECGLDRGDEGRRLLVAPRRVLAEGVAGPVLVVDQPALGGQLTTVVVDPVAGERRRPDETALAVPVGVDRQLAASTRRSGRSTARTAAGAPPAAPGKPVRPPADWVKRTQPSPTSWFELPVGQAHGGDREALAEPDGRRADRTAAAVAGVDDRAVVGELGVGGEMVGEAEADPPPAAPPASRRCPARCRRAGPRRSG